MRVWLFDSMERMRPLEGSLTHGLTGDQIMSEMLEAYQALQVTTHVMNLAEAARQAKAEGPEREHGEESDEDDDPMVDDDGWPSGVDGPASRRN